MITPESQTVAEQVVKLQEKIDVIDNEIADRNTKRNTIQLKLEELKRTLMDLLKKKDGRMVFSIHGNTTLTMQQEGNGSYKFHIDYIQKIDRSDRSR